MEKDRCCLSAAITSFGARPPRGSFAIARTWRSNRRGVSDLSPVCLDRSLLGWAEIIFVMEPHHRQELGTRFEEVCSGKKVICLNIPDQYKYMDPAGGNSERKGISPSPGDRPVTGPEILGSLPSLYKEGKPMRSNHRTLIFEEQLRCLRCHGDILVGEILFDPDSPLPNRIFSLRCLNCGGIFFPEEEHRKVSEVEKNADLDDRPKRGVGADRVGGGW